LNADENKDEHSIFPPKNQPTNPHRIHVIFFIA
jgi:hypothetical protein